MPSKDIQTPGKTLAMNGRTEFDEHIDVNYHTISTFLPPFKSPRVLHNRTYRWWTYPKELLRLFLHEVTFQGMHHQFRTRLHELLLPDIRWPTAGFSLEEPKSQSSVEDESENSATTIDLMLGLNWGFSCVQALASWTSCSQISHKSFLEIRFFFFFWLITQ